VTGDKRLTLTGPNVWAGA